MSELKKIRRILGISQVRLAELAQTTPPQIQRLESGQRKLTKEWAERLAPHLSVTAQELLFPDDSVDYSSKNALKEKTTGIPILLQLGNKEWIEDSGDIWDAKDSNLNSFDSRSDKQLFAIKLLLELQNDLAKPNDLAICSPILEGDMTNLANNDVVLTKTLFSDTNFAKYSFYRLLLKVGSSEIELDNCFVNAESEKIILDINDMKDTAIVAKVCYFVRLP